MTQKLQCNKVHEEKAFEEVQSSAMIRDRHRETRHRGNTTSLVPRTSPMTFLQAVLDRSWGIILTFKELERCEPVNGSEECF